MAAKEALKEAKQYMRATERFLHYGKHTLPATYPVTAMPLSTVTLGRKGAWEEGREGVWEKGRECGRKGGSVGGREGERGEGSKGEGERERD